MRYDQLLEGRNALIAGEPGPLRQAVAALFLFHGAGVALLGGPESEGLDCRHFAADLGDTGAVSAACKAATEYLGNADVLVNLFTTHRPALAHECEDEAVLDALRRGPQAALLCAQQVLPGMMERRHGAIVNILPVYERYTVPGVSATAGAAGGLKSLSLSIAMDYCRFDIRSNCILYSASFLDGAQEEGRWANTQPIHRRGEPAEIAAAALYLASDMSKHVTGEVLLADGGATIIAHKQYQYHA